MGMALDDLRAAPPELELDAPEWPAYVAWLESVGVPPGLLAGADPREFHLLIARGAVATALAFDLGDDCGIYNVGTLEHARRRGLGTALTARLLHDARARGRTTASLQATAMAEGLYAALGFRDLGRILELVP
jgi:ribosomal protein S18 acetylase RimI-like enzyme